MSDKTLLIVDDSKVSRMMLSALIKQKKPELVLIEAEHAADAQQHLADPRGRRYVGSRLGARGLLGAARSRARRQDEVRAIAHG